MKNYEIRNSCLIWDTQATAWNDPERKGITIDSPRTGGKYFISEEAIPKVKDLDDERKARLTSWLVVQRSLANRCPRIDGKRIDDEDYGQTLTMSERAGRLLKLIRMKTRKIGIPLDVSAYSPTKHDSFYEDNDYQEMMAWSESTDINEVLSLTKHLWEKGWVTSSLFITQKEMLRSGFNTSPLYRGRIYLTMEGYGYLEKLERVAVDSSKAFVAMWFDPSMDEAWVQGIKPGITDSGYEPIRVDEVEHKDRIDDLIIAEIRRSRFIVADFTHGEDGAKGGVYYEAGFAHGLNIPAFFTCKKNLIDKLHFDIRQYSTVLWETPEELRTKLANRISAEIGDGPRKRLQNKLSK